MRLPTLLQKDKNMSEPTMKNGADELVTIIGLCIIALAAIYLLKAGGKEIAIAIAGGLIGYLKGQSPGG
jgi:hypothetical protein